MQDDTENPKPVQWDHLKEWDGEGFKRERTCVYLRPVHIDVWQKPSQYCKAIGLQLKIKFKNSTLKDYHQKKKKKARTWQNQLSIWRAGQRLDHRAEAGDPSLVREQSKLSPIETPDPVPGLLTSPLLR